MSDELRVTLVQHAASLEPAENRAALAELTPTGNDLVVFPEVFARDFGEPGSDVSAFAEPLTGPFASAVGEVAAGRGTTVVAGMFESSADPARPYNTLVLRGAVEAAYRKVHLYDSFGFRESDRITAGEVDPCVVDLAGFRVGLLTCYDLRFPELARLVVEAGAEVLVLPAAWVAGPHKVQHWRTSPAPVPSRTRPSWSRSASRVRATPGTPGHRPLGRRAGRGRHGARRPDRHAGPGLARGRATDQPLAGEPPPVAFHPVSRARTAHAATSRSSGRSSGRSSRRSSRRSSGRSSRRSSGRARPAG
ncbi:MAG: nitrilase-related carbon-nitrogen hydrolase [Nocardioides sp.]